MKVALTGCTGKIGGAVLNSLLTHSLIPASDLVICTSSSASDPKHSSLKDKGLTIRHSTYDDPQTMVAAFSGCNKLFLVSTPRISMDFNNAPDGEGREKHHIAAIKAAQEAGVEHIYYTSLAFGPESQAAVMRAHLRTEAFLKGMQGTKFTVIREGLYNESWPLYFGYYDVKGDERKEVVVAGDGPVSWTSIADLGYASALVLADSSGKYEGKTFYLSGSEATSLKEIARMVSRVKGQEVHVKVVSHDECYQHYVEKGIDPAYVEWWVTTCEVLNGGECLIKDNTFSELLSRNGVKPKPVEETIKDMLGKK